MNKRPADYQIKKEYKYSRCGNTIEIEVTYLPPEKCHCGGDYEYIGESYPANPNEWEG